MLAVTVPVLVPDAGERVNHPAVSLAVQVSVPPPVLEILNVLGAGVAPPAVPEKVRLLTLSWIAGVAAAPVTDSVTGRIVLLIRPFRLVSVIMTFVE